MRPIRETRMWVKNIELDIYWVELVQLRSQVRAIAKVSVYITVNNRQELLNSPRLISGSQVELFAVE
jgi:sRNA-binding regulator protein Hfq